MSHRTIRTLLLLAVSCAAMLAFAPGAMAHGRKGDRNGDRIPDRWERTHHLSLKFNQAKRDQDHDGLRNRAEWMAGDDPHDGDTDNDGTNDGQEKAGQVLSFTNGILIVHLFNGDDVKGTVDANTEFECKAAPTPITPVTPLTGTTRAANDGGGGDEGDNNDGSGDHHGQGDDQGDHHGDQGDDEGDDNDEDDDGQQPGCDATKLTPGATVGEAELKATAAGLVFEKIELVG
jgi:hypothetical protein